MLPEGFTVEKKPPEGFVLDSLPKGFTLDKEPSVGLTSPFMAKHPITYGIYGAVKETAKAIIPYVKYIEPSERKRFMELSQQKQTRELLIQNLESVAMLGVAPIAKGTWNVFAKHLPKTASKLAGVAKTRLWGKKPTLQQAAKGRQAEIEKLMPDDFTSVGKLRGIYEGLIGKRFPFKPKTKQPWKMTKKEFQESGWADKPISAAVKTTDGKVYTGKAHGEIPEALEEGVTAGWEVGGKFISSKHIIEGDLRTSFIRQAAAKVPKQPVIESPPSPAVQKVVSALKEAKPIRKKQEAIYTKARGEKLARSLKAGEKTVGEKGYYAELGALKGKMPRVQFESIRGKIGQQDIDALFVQIKNSPILSEWEKLPARKGLAKLFGEHGGAVPTEGELSLLKEVFGSEFVKTSLSKRTLFQKLKGAGLEIANIPRSIMASFDLSAPLRQGIFLIGRPKQWVPAFGKQFHYFVSEKAYQNLTKTIRAKPTYPLMKEHKLALTELGTKLVAREEAFMSSWAEKIPLVGIGVRASSRAYTGFLNQLRANIFDDFVKKGIQLGIKDPRFLKDAARFINTATGRGGLGKLEAVAVPLNTFFFSPRLLTSRLQLVNPAFYVKLQPQVRKEALKSLFTFAGTASTVAGLMALNGVKVGLDPRSADFMKLKHGNTRYDILGGFQQQIRLAAQLISGEIISSTTGKTLTLGEGYKPITRLGIIGRFLEYKEAPVVSFVTGLLRGQPVMGGKLDVPTEVANRFIPMAAQDIVDLYNEQGLEGLPLAAPAIFGVGVQTYGGVQSYGLKGKDYPKLNAELQRLKTSMGFPSTSAYGEELTNKEYKNLKKQTGLEIAKELTQLFSMPSYNRVGDDRKVRFIEQKIDIAKDKIKRKMFPQKRQMAKMITRIKQMTPLKDEEARALAKTKLNSIGGRQEQ